MTYQRQPYRVEALQFTGDNHSEMKEFTGPQAEYLLSVIAVSDWVLKTDGNCMPMPNDSFVACYEPVPAPEEILRGLLTHPLCTKNKVLRGAVQGCIELLEEGRDGP